MAKQPQLRIIGGRWRGRQLSFANADGLRPTGDRIRETLFNWLAPDIHGARCLDLFAGSGALGLEALSRGAAEVTLIEQNKDAHRHISQHLEQLKGELQLQQASALKGNCIEWLLKQRQPSQQFDVVFIDPPFAEKLWNDCIDSLIQAKALTKNAAIYVESPKDQQLIYPQSWQLHRSKNAGSVKYQLYYAD